VRKLEDALADTNTSLSDEPHSLLTGELMLIKRPLERKRLVVDISSEDLQRNKEEEEEVTLSRYEVLDVIRSPF
jgi:hypothetical protein